MVNTAEDIARLAIAECKLYHVCEKKALVADGKLNLSKEALEDLMRQDIDLCRQRGELKNAINKALGQQAQETKRYGQD